MVAQQQLIGWVYHIHPKKIGVLLIARCFHHQCNEISEHTHKHTSGRVFSNVIQRDRQKDVR